MAGKWDKRFLDLAKLISTWSKDPSTKVGAVIVRPDNTIVSTGFNGFPRHMIDNPEWLENREEKYSRVIHAEMNAMLFAKENLSNYALYIYPLMPCDRCFVHIAQTGINYVIAPSCPPDKAERWKESLEKTRNYAKDCGVTLFEVDYE